MKIRRDTTRQRMFWRGRIFRYFLIRRRYPILHHLLLLRTVVQVAREEKRIRRLLKTWRRGRGWVGWIIRLGRTPAILGGRVWALRSRSPFKGGLSIGRRGLLCLRIAVISGGGQDLGLLPWIWGICRKLLLGLRVGIRSRGGILIVWRILVKGCSLGRGGEGFLGFRGSNFLGFFLFEKVA